MLCLPLTKTGCNDSKQGLPVWLGVEVELGVRHPSADPQQALCGRVGRSQLSLCIHHQNRISERLDHQLVDLALYFSGQLIVLRSLFHPRQT